MGDAAPIKELPRYVGYGEIAEATGMDKRQIQTAFPWLGRRNAERMSVISDLAVTNPSKLKPEQLASALSSAFSEWARRAGANLPDGTLIAAITPLTDEQIAQHASAVAQTREQSINALADVFAQLDVVRGWLVVGGLVPALRPAADFFLEKMTGQQPRETQEELRDRDRHP